MLEKARIFKSSWYIIKDFLFVFLYAKKWPILCLRSPILQSKQVFFNTLSPDLLTLYRRLNPIKIWPTYAVPPTTTLYPRSTYDLWRAGSSPTIFQTGWKTYPAQHDLSERARTNLRCILDQHTLSPIKARSLPICPFFQSGRKRGLVGSLVWTGL